MKHTYDGQGRVSTVSNTSGTVAVFTYYADGYGLSVYTAAAPINSRDDWGLKQACCKIKEDYTAYVPNPYGGAVPMPYIPRIVPDVINQQLA
jgi:hypothetical protein